MSRFNTNYTSELSKLSGVDLGDDGYASGPLSILFLSGLTAANTTGVFLQIHDLADGYVEVPEADAVPLVSIPVFSTSALPGYMEWRAPLHGLRVRNLAVVTSSTHSTYTQVASDCFVHVEFYKN